MDLVVNHTSDEHAWFIESKSQKKIHIETFIYGERERTERTEQLGGVFRRLYMGVRQRNRLCTIFIVFKETAGSQLGK